MSFSIPEYQLLRLYLLLQVAIVLMNLPSGCTMTTQACSDCKIYPANNDDFRDLVRKSRKMEQNPAKIIIFSSAPLIFSGLYLKHYQSPCGHFSRSVEFSCPVLFSVHILAACGVFIFDMKRL